MLDSLAAFPEGVSNPWDEDACRRAQWRTLSELDGDEITLRAVLNDLERTGYVIGRGRTSSDHRAQRWVKAPVGWAEWLAS